jgi:N-acetylglucosaminyldiphosphoundecaprenol N-acetyl-beta-D-mannosaminyltransferase
VHKRFGRVLFIAGSTSSLLKGAPLAYGIIPGVEKVTDQEKVHNIAKRSKIEVLGVQLDNITLEEAADLVVAWAREHRENPQAPTRMIVTVNPEYVMTAGRDPAFMNLINSADLVTPDGIGLILAGKILGRPFRERVTGVALAERLFQISSDSSTRLEGGLKLFLLGAGPGAAEEAATLLQAQYPAIQIAGTFAGQGGPEGDAETATRVKEAGADVVLVAYGMVKQDWWTFRNKDKCGAAVAIGVGGVIDYKAGRVALAPARLRKWGLEWAYRLYKEPWRWRRQLALPRFVAAVLWARLKRFTIRRFTI